MEATTQRKGFNVAPPGSLQAGLRRRECDGVVFYESPTLARLGVGHAFSTRVGGVSEPPFESLTLGSPAQHREKPGNLAENWRRLLHAAGCAGDVVQVHQVHGGDVVRVEHGTVWTRDPPADALVSTDPSRPIAVRVADCCPILLASRDGRTVAAVHAGWRGVVTGVIESAVEAMNVTPEHLVAAVGPCIGFKSFEVGPEVLAAFSQKFGDAAPLRADGPNGKGHVHLAASAALALTIAGVPAEQIDIALLCTVENPHEFFSHRRDNGLTGRMAAVVQARTH